MHDGCPQYDHRSKLMGQRQVQRDDHDQRRDTDRSLGDDKGGDHGGRRRIFRCACLDGMEDGNGEQKISDNAVVKLNR